MSGPKFFKEVEFSRGADARPCCLFCSFWMHIWIDPYQGDGCPPIKALGGLLFPDMRRFAPNL
jgi:hypothetical protein